jgi:tRNA (guanine26-N2/guanine27-N2)-dimethyltransferase
MERVSLLSEYYREGKTSLAVPFVDEPSMIPAFFNPRGRFVRDISIVCYNAYSSEILKGIRGGKKSSNSSLTFADSLAGIGARGIRVANEVPNIGKVYLNDINSKALDFAKKSAKMNEVEYRCIFSRNEVCSFLVSRMQDVVSERERFDFVDVDPFGSPSEYIDCALRSVTDGGLISLTATDSAVLCGVYPKVALRKYLGLALRTEYSHEIAMRLLFGLVSQSAMRMETGIVPIFSHHDMHYFRIYASVKVGNSFSKQNEKNIGFILHCFKCGHRSIVSRDEFYSLSPSKESQTEKKEKQLSVSSNQIRSGSQILICSVCGRGGPDRGGRLAIGGPLWTGPIQCTDFVSKCYELFQHPIFSQELDIPLYYDLRNIPLRKGTSTPKINAVIQKLRTLGFLASRTRLNPNALRTDAKIESVQSVVSELAR